MNDLNTWMFFKRWLAKNAAWITVLFFMLNLWFKPFFNLVALLGLAGSFYIAWLNEKDKYTVRVFGEEPFRPKTTLLYWCTFALELMILLVGLHFLYKGFTSVTGVTEQWFDTQYTGIGRIMAAVSFITALAVVGGMMAVLYMISHTTKNRKLIIIYILADIFILMPFNFMFSYENNQNESLSHFYANAIPVVYDRLKPELQRQMNLSTKVANEGTIKVEQEKSNVEMLKQDYDNAREALRQRIKDNSFLPDSLRVPLRDFRDDVANTLRLLNDAKTKVSNETTSKVGTKLDSLTTANRYAQLKTVEPVLKLLNNGKLEKSALYDTIIYARETLMELYNTDSTLIRDTTMTNVFDRLKVEKEPITTGFFNLLKYLTAWALKPEIAAPAEEGPRAISEAQCEWNEGLTEKRLFCFLFSILIDIFPLIIALSYLYYSKQRARVSN